VICTLCNSKTTLFSEYKERAFHICSNCETVLLHPKFYLTATEEKGRYDLHSDNVEAIGYQNFVRPITDAVAKYFTAEDKGLDFGCGKTEIVKYVLEQKGFNVKGYDPFYFNQKELLKGSYNYITSCEVIEHLYYPKEVFQLLYNMLLPNGKLFLKTSLYNLDLDFEKWWYKNDPTHVTLYTLKSLDYIKNFYGYRALTIYENHIEFHK